ncbi:PTS sugar transporter subunit IIB [Alkalibacter sp. M17DMB]|nr:PTS sugar transporter subunit IIB [Alkalibacter mobilis]
MKKILVACGTAMATSTIVAKKVGSLCKQQGIQCATVQCTADEAESKARSLRPDVIVGTCDLLENLGVPVINGQAFLTGVESEKTMDELLAVLSS